MFEKILHVCAHVAKETPLSPGLGTKQKDLFDKYFQVEIDRRMVDFIVGLDSEMQQLVDACSKTGGLKQRTLNSAFDFLTGSLGSCCIFLQESSFSFKIFLQRKQGFVGVIIIVMNSFGLKCDRRSGIMYLLAFDGCAKFHSQLPMLWECLDPLHQWLIGSSQDGSHLYLPQHLAGFIAVEESLPRKVRENMT